MTRWLESVGLSVLLLVAACASQPMKDPQQGTSESFAYATWKAKRGSITVLVDSLSASFRDAEAYVPIPIAIGNDNYGGTITLSPEIFTLIDQTGTVYGAAAYEEVSRNYPQMLADEDLTAGRPVVSQQFELQTRIPSDFYPAVPSMRIDEVHLDAYTWMRDTLYFPRPESGLGGLMTLRLQGGGIEPPMEVKFRVPLKGVKIR